MPNGEKTNFIIIVIFSISTTTATIHFTCQLCEKKRGSVSIGIISKDEGAVEGVESKGKGRGKETCTLEGR